MSSSKAVDIDVNTLLKSTMGSGSVAGGWPYRSGLGSMRSDSEASRNLLVVCQVLLQAPGAEAFVDLTVEPLAGGSADDRAGRGPATGLGETVLEVVQHLPRTGHWVDGVGRRCGHAVPVGHAHLIILASRTVTDRGGHRGWCALDGGAGIASRRVLPSVQRGERAAGPGDGSS